MDKKTFRQHAKNVRKNAFSKNSAEILKNLQKIPEFSCANTIFSYVNTQTEVITLDVNQYILNKKKTLALPKVYGKSMEFHKVFNLENDLISGSFNILEPLYNLPKIYDFDVILVPAVAYSMGGYRLGYGAGFYDKYLENKKGVFIGICFDVQIFNEIPKDEFDIKMDFLVTDTQIIKCD